MATTHDVIVLGGGPAGLTAAIYLARARMRTVLVDAGTVGGQMNLTEKVVNYPGSPPTSGAALAREMKRQALEFGAELVGQAEIARIVLEGDEKLVEVEDEGAYTAPAVIVAPGGTPRVLDIPGAERFRGQGISFCATCDGDFFTGKQVVVVGGGNSALEEAVALTQYADKVTIVHELDHFQGYQWAIDEVNANEKIELLLEQTVTEYVGEEALAGLASVHKRTGERTVTPAAGVFLFIGYTPNTGWLKEIVELSDRGEIVADELMRTSVHGVFAAGDARKKRYRQITTAVADGTVAALAAIDHVHGRG